MGPIGRLWRGEYRLVITFWVFFFGIVHVMNAIATFALGPEGILVVFASIIFFLYVIFISVAVWRSAMRHPGKQIFGNLSFADLSRIWVVAIWLFAISEEVIALVAAR